MNKINIRRLCFLSVVVLSFITMYVSVGISFAWLSHDEIFNPVINIGDFEARIKPTCNGVNVYTIPNAFDSINKVFRLTATAKAKLTAAEQEGKHFIEDLKLNVVVNSNIHAYLRVKIYTEWLLTRTFLTIQRDPIVETVYAEEIFPYHLVNVGDQSNPSYDWYYDEDTNYVYYKVLITEGLREIPLIDGCNGYNTSSTRNYSEDCMATIGIKVELVQANRYQAIWGLDHLPWEVNA